VITSLINSSHNCTANTLTTPWIVRKAVHHRVNALETYKYCVVSNSIRSQLHFATKSIVILSRHRPLLIIHCEQRSSYRTNSCGTNNQLYESFKHIIKQFKQNKTLNFETYHRNIGGYIIISIILSDVKIIKPLTLRIPDKLGDYQHSKLNKIVMYF